MNKTITSKDLLLSAAKEIAQQEGFENLSVRGVAAKCGVSVGSIYNYFPDKSAMIHSIIDDFWLSAIQEITIRSISSYNFLDVFQQTFEQFHRYLSGFDADWLRQIAFLGDTNQPNNVSAHFIQLSEHFMRALDSDSSVSDTLWTSDFSQNDFVLFVYENMIMMLQRELDDCSYFVKLCARILYK